MWCSRLCPSSSCNELCLSSEEGQRSLWTNMMMPQHCFFSVFQERPLSRAPFDGPSSQRFWCTIPKALTGTRSIKMLSTWWDLSSRAKPSVSFIFSHDSGNDKEEQDVPCTRGKCFVLAIPTRVHCTKIVQDNKSHLSFLLPVLFSFQHRLIVLCWEAGQSDDREPRKNFYHYWYNLAVFKLTILSLVNNCCKYPPSTHHIILLY